MAISPSSARSLGIGAIIAVIALILSTLAACHLTYKTDIEVMNDLFIGVIFYGPGLLVALLALRTSNPLRAVGASIGLGSCILWAFYGDCVKPSIFGGFGIVFVPFLGTATAIFGALITPSVARVQN